MDADTITLAIGSVQTIALAWIAAWQARAAVDVRRLNHTVEAAVDRAEVASSRASTAPLHDRY